MYDTPEFLPDFKILTPELVHAIPKVMLNFSGALSDLRDENVVYVEQLVDFAQLEEALALAEGAEFTASIVVRCATVDEVERVAGKQHPVIVGVMVCSPELAQAAQNAWLPHVALGTPEAQARSQRVTSAVALFDDFTISEFGEIDPGPVSAWIRDQSVPVVCDPHDELAAEEIETLADHPLPLLRTLGFKATAAAMTTERLLELAEKLELGIEDLYELTMEAMEAAFLPQPLQQRIIDEQIFPVFARWASGVPNTATPTDEAENSEEGNTEGDEVDLADIDPAFLAELGIDPADFLRSHNDDQDAK